ncbi:MAG: TRAP transporter small permease [Pseudomonadota bacterium]
MGLHRGMFWLARTIHVISAFWVLVLAVMIFVDVMGRYFFDSPLLGTAEIIKNSVVSVTFLQLPLAIYTGSMLRTTVMAELTGPIGRRLIRTLTALLGIAFFLGTAFSTWDPMVDAWAIGEYEGEGALRVPTYPVRTLVLITSIFAAMVYAMLMFLDWTGRLPPDLDADAEAARV